MGGRKYADVDVGHADNSRDGQWYVRTRLSCMWSGSDGNPQVFMRNVASDESRTSRYVVPVRLVSIGAYNYKL